MTEGWALVAVSAFYIFLLLYSLRFIVKCLTGGAVGPALLVVVGIGLSAAYTVHILGGYYPGDMVTALVPQHIARAAPVVTSQAPVISPHINVNVSTGDWTIPLAMLLAVLVVCTAAVIIAFMVIRFRMWSRMQEAKEGHRVRTIEPLGKMLPKSERRRALTDERE